jgi:adenosine deaminase
MLGDVGVAEEADEDGKSANVHNRGELHVHMNGAIPTSTIREILADEATVLPAGFEFERDLVRTTPCQSLTQYLTPWQVLRLFPRARENIDRLTLAVVAAMADNNVRFVELRSSDLANPGAGRMARRSWRRALQDRGSRPAHRHLRH